MRFAPVYWNEAEPAGETLDQLLYRLRRLDADDGLIFDSVSLDDLMELSEETLVLDALMTTRVLLDRKMIAMERVMNAASQALDVTASQISPPFKRQGVINVAAIFELSDGQTISVVFHNPDAKNVKALKPSDDLISWKWLLNKRDVTIAVAPEKGEDLPIRLVARRLMLLAEKNSRAFQRLNQKRAARLENIEALKGEIKGLEIELDQLTKDINVARLEAEERAIQASESGLVAQAVDALLGAFKAQPGLDDRLYAFAERRDVERDGPAFAEEVAGNWYNQNANAVIGGMGLTLQGVMQAEDALKPLAADYVMTKLREMSGGDGAINPPAVEPEPQPLPSTTVLARYLTKSGKDGAVIKQYDNGKGMVSYSWIGEWGAGSSGDLDEIIKSVRSKTSRRGVTLAEGADIAGLIAKIPEPEPTVEPGGETIDNPYWRVMTLTERARVLATIGLATKAGRPSVRAKAFAALGWQDLPDDIREKLLQHPAISTEPTPEPIPDPEPTDETDITPDVIARVDAAYPFANATDEFKAWVAESVDAAQGPFATARAMEERAKTHGASIEWGFFGGAALDSVYVEDDEDEDDDDDMDGMGDDDIDDRDDRDDRDDDDDERPLDPNTLPLFDAASEHWKQQPRDRKTGRWALRRAKRAKQAVSGLIDKAMKAAQKVAHHARIHRGGDAMKGDPLVTAMGELTGALDSAAILDAARPGGTEYVGKIRKDGEIVGRADIDDEGWAMVYVGVLGDARVVMPNTGRRPAQRLRDNAAASLIDWVFHAESSANGPYLNREDFLKAFNEGRFDLFSKWEGYAEAAKEFLEGDIENVKRPKKRLEFKMEALADLDGAIKPKPISKAVRVAKTPDAQLKAAMQIAGNKDVRYYLNGVKVEDGRLTASDGHRLVVVKTDTSAWDHLRPQAADKDPDEYVDDGVIIGRDGKLIDGRFPEIERVIPQQKSTDRVGEFDAEKLAARARGIAKAFKLTDEVYPGITLVIGDREVGVNANYLLDMAETFLRFGYKTFSMQEPGANSGILALSPDGKVTQVVMPMHDPKPSPFAPIGSETEVGNDQAWREWTNREAAPAPAPEPQPEPNPEPVSAGNNRFSPGDTVYLYWLATDQWEPVNYRGPLGDAQAVVVKDGMQMTVNMADLRAENPEPAAFTAWTPEHQIKIAADDVHALREVDVERVLTHGDLSEAQVRAVAEYITNYRIDLRYEVEDVLADLFPTAQGETPADPVRIESGIVRGLPSGILVTMGRNDKTVVGPKRYIGDFQTTEAALEHVKAVDRALLDEQQFAETVGRALGAEWRAMGNSLSAASDSAHLLLTWTRGKRGERESLTLSGGPDGKIFITYDRNDEELSSGWVPSRDAVIPWITDHVSGGAASEMEPQGQTPADPRPELEAALQALIDSETDIDRYDAELDRIAGLAEAAGLMDALDAKLNEAADRLTVLLNEEAARVA